VQTTRPDADEFADEEVTDLDPEGDDDIVGNRRAAAKTAQPKIQRVGYAAWEKALMVVAVIIGIGIGVWFAGRPAQLEATQSPALGEATATADPSVRIAELEAVLAADPDDVAAHLELGVLAFDSGDYDTARDQWLRVTQVDPNEVQAWYNLGFAYLSASPSDMAKAREAWDKVIEIDPNSELAQTIQTHLSGLTGTAAPSATPTPGG
jgi:cytochrome c-type biogenesis protein CcmH/NrfG